MPRRPPGEIRAQLPFRVSGATVAYPTLRTYVSSRRAPREAQVKRD